MGLIKKIKRSFSKEDGDSISADSTIPTRFRENKEMSKEININSKDFKKVIDNLVDEDLKEVAKDIRKKGLVKFDKKIDLKTKADADEFIRIEINDFLSNTYENLKEEVRDRRKEGKDTAILDFKTMAIPLKIEVFKTTSKKEDLEKILELVEWIKKELSEMGSEEKEEGSKIDAEKLKKTSEELKDSREKIQKEDKETNKKTNKDKPPKKENKPDKKKTSKNKKKKSKSKKKTGKKGTKNKKNKPKKHGKKK